MDYSFHTIEEKPQYEQDFISLVESSFGYKKPYHFNIDFFPLVNLKNFQNCYFILYQEKIIATCAYQKRAFSLEESYSVAFMGAISVHEKFRGKDFGRRLVQHVLGKIQNCAWIGLWSEKESFFEKFSFSPFSRQYFLPKQTLQKAVGDYSFQSKKIVELSGNEKQYWQESYEKLAAQYMTLERKSSHWSDIFEIHSADIYFLKYQNQRVGYAIVNKGMDLLNIVHEFYAPKEHELELLRLLNQQYEIWLPCFQFAWDEKFIGSSLLVKKGDTELWEIWKARFDQNENRGKHFFISGLDSV